MKKHFTLPFVALFLGLSSLFAQETKEFERVYYTNPTNVEEDDYSLEIKNGVAQFDHCKFSLKIVNNSNDFLMYKPEETVFKYPFGDKHTAAKSVLIQPNGSKTKTIQAEGGDQYRQERFSVDFNGLYRIPVDGDIAKAEDFKLPASKNNFTAGNFKVVLRKYDASTREAKAVFECTYLGDKVAIVNPSNLSVKAQHKKTGDDLVYANDDKKSKPKVLRKGDKIKFNAIFHIEGRIVDMQFATMYIQWNDTFVETKMISLDAPTVDFEINEAMTREKN